MAAVEWSDDVAQAEWIGTRLTDFGDGTATSVVPAGFDAYARVLHPAHDGDDNPVTWAAVAAATGPELTAESGFTELALVPAGSGGATAELWAPAEGTLDRAQGTALAGLLRSHTTAPDECWFCLWDGWGWDNAVPGDVAAGPRVALPNREYFIGRGPVEAGIAAIPEEDQSPNLWWPADHAWCVGSEIDLPFTYVGGSRALIDAILDDPNLEAQEITPGHRHHLRLSEALAELVTAATEEALDSGASEVQLNRGTVSAHLREPGRVRSGLLTIKAATPWGSEAESTFPLRHGDRELRETVRWALESALHHDLL